MPASIQIVLTDEEDRTLSELRVATTVPQRTRDRAHMLRLNAQGWTVPVIAEIFECHEHTVRATLRRWQKGVRGLWEALGVQNKNGKRLIYKLLNNGLSKTLAPTIVINWLRSYPEAGQAKPNDCDTFYKKGLWMETNSSQPPRQARP